MKEEYQSIAIDQQDDTEPVQSPADTNSKEHDAPSEKRKPFVRVILAGVGAAILLTTAAAWWWQARKYEETDDAQVDGYIYPVSARISGHLAHVYVEEGQSVKAGAVLVEIDSKDYEVAARQARAQYEDALAAADAAGLVVPVTRTGSVSQISASEAELESAEAGVTVALKRVEEEKARLIDAHAAATTAKDDLQRYAQLIGKREISQQQYDRTVAAADAATANVSGAEAGVRSAQEEVVQARARVRASLAHLEDARVSPNNVSAVIARAKSAKAKVARALAALEQAKLDLSYTRIVAPVDGIVGRRAAYVGQNVEPGQDLMALVPLNDVWITANYKEDQLARMHPGQDVSIEVDAYGRRWSGKVTSIGGATGARYSVLPPENATGNYVKVVQRIPVRIDLTGDTNKDGLLRPGMSVVPKVRVR